MAYSEYLGGIGDDQGRGIAVDSSGNVYITGLAASGFPTTPGPIFAGGAHDAFVTKLDSSGTVSYSTFIGSGADDAGLKIAVQGTNVFVVGNTQQGSTFPTTNPTIGPGGGQDAFVAQFNSTGGNVFATVIGGSGSESGNAIAVDGSGAIYLTGETASSDFPVTAGAFQGTKGSGSDAFLMKLTSGGSGPPTFSTFLGASGDERARGIALDGSNNAYISGSTTSSGLGTGTSALSGPSDAFAAKFDTTGNEVYFTYVGGSSGDGADAIAVDSTGAAYITGQTQSSSLPQQQGTRQGIQDAFVTKLDTSGVVTFSTYLGGSATGVGTVDVDEGFGIALDASNNIYVTGTTGASSFPVTTDAPAGTTSLQGPTDAFVTELDSSGSTTAVFSMFYGGTGNEDILLSGAADAGIAGAIAVDSSGNIYITGTTNSSAGIAAIQNSFGGGVSDAFAAKISP